MATETGRKGFFRRAREKGSENDRDGIDGTEVQKWLEDGTKRRYKYTPDVWKQYVL